MHGRHIIFLLIVALVMSYFAYEARLVLFSPSLYVFEPTNWTEFHTTRIHIAGKTDVEKKVFVNGREFLLNQKGEFDGMLTIDPGYNEIGFLARDRFGNETRKIIKVVVR